MVGCIGCMRACMLWMDGWSERYGIGSKGREGSAESRVKRQAQSRSCVIVFDLWC